VTLLASTTKQATEEKDMTNKKPTEDYIKEVEQDDRIIKFDAGEVIRDYDKLIKTHAIDTTENVSKEDILRGLDLLEESKRSDRFFGMRLNGKSIDDIENKFLAMFAEFVSLMALFIGMLGFGVLLWAIFGG